MKYLIFNGITSIVITLVAGCSNAARVPEGPSVIIQESLRFTPPENKSGLYVIRPDSISRSAYLFDLSLDFQEWGSLARNTYLYEAIPAGKHVLKLGGSFVITGGPPLLLLTADVRSTQGIINFEAGKNYFFVTEPGAISPYIKMISEEDGRRLVKKAKLSGASRQSLAIELGRKF